MENVLVSVIINNYNYGRFLEQAIKSVLEQTYNNIELIVVDDGSTDDSIQIINKYNEYIIPIIKENGGQASALNAGWEKAKGELIVFLDSDDYLLSDTIYKVMNIYRKNSENVSKIQYLLRILYKGEILNKHYPEKIFWGKSEDYKQLIISELWDQSPPTSGNVFTKKYLKEIMPIPENDFKICADNYLIMQAPFLGEVLSINECLGIYRVHGNNNWISIKETISLERIKLLYNITILKIHLLQKFSKGVSERNYFELWRYKIVLAKIGLLEKEKLILIIWNGLISVFCDRKIRIFKKVVALLWILLVSIFPLGKRKIQKIIFTFWTLKSLKEM